MKNKIATVYEFRKIGPARAKSMQIKRDYGFKPTVFRATKDGHSKYVVVKAKVMKRIR